MTSATALFQRLFQFDRAMSPITTDAVSDLVEHADHGPTVSLTPRITPHTRERVVEDLRCGPKAVAKKTSTDLDLQSAAALVRCVRS
jgi:hypothetical protein